MKTIIRFVPILCGVFFFSAQAPAQPTVVFQDRIANYIPTRTYENCNPAVVRTTNYGSTSIATSTSTYAAPAGDQFAVITGTTYDEWFTLAVPANVTARYGQMFIRLGKDPTNISYTHIQMSSTTSPALYGGFAPGPTAGAGAYLIFDTAGGLEYYNGSTYHMLSPIYSGFQLNQMFNVTINYDLTAHTFDLWIQQGTTTTKVLSAVSFLDSGFGSTVRSMVLGDAYCYAPDSTVLDQWYWYASTTTPFTTAGTMIPNVTPPTGTYTVSLAPGEGTVLCVGSSSDFSAIQQAYFNVKPTSTPTYGRTSGQQYQFPCILRGIYQPGVFGAEEYLANPYGEVPSDYGLMGISVWQWYDELFQLLNQSGVNTVYFDQGETFHTPYVVTPTTPPPGMPTGTPNPAYNADCVTMAAAATASPYSFKTIFQNDDTYFSPPQPPNGPYSPQIPPPQLIPGTGMDSQAVPTSFFSSSPYSAEPVWNAYQSSYLGKTTIFAWAPVEEIPSWYEAAYAINKSYIVSNSNLQNQLVYQVDSQQSNASGMSSKQTPYVDIFAYDGDYAWLCNGGSAYTRAIPGNIAIELMYYLQQYALGIEGLPNNLGPGKPQGVAAMQGDAQYQLYTGGAGTLPAQYGWQNTSGWVDPHSGFTGNGNSEWAGWDWNFPPVHGERLQIWTALCAGLKGVLFFDAVDASPQQSLTPKTSAGVTTITQPNVEYHVGMIHSDLGTGVTSSANGTTPTGNTFQWNEVADTFRKLAVFDRVIPAFHTSSTQFMNIYTLSGVNYAENASGADQNLFVNSFVDLNGKKYIILQNTNIGQNANGSTTVGVDANGNLTGGAIPGSGVQSVIGGAAPAGARECTITLASGYSGLSVIPAETLAPVNLVPNGNMETSANVSGVEVPQGWEALPGYPATIMSDHSSISTALDSMFTTPNTSLLISTGNTSPSWIYSPYIYGIQGGKTYQLSVWVYTTNAYVGMQEYESSGGWGTQGSGGYLVQNDTPNHWTHLTYQFTTRSGSSWMFLGTLVEPLGGAGYVYMDDVTLNVVGP